MSDNVSQNCRKCGADVDAGSNFCSCCGARIYNPAQINARKNFSVKLSIYSALMTVFFIMLFSFITGFAFSIYDQELFSKPERLLAISIIGPVTGILISSILTSYLFIEIKVKETAAGASSVIILFKIADFIIAGTFSIEGAGTALLSCLIAFAGAWAGYYAKKSIKFKI